MRKAQLGVLVGLLCASFALGGCNTLQGASEDARQAGDQAGQAFDDARNAAGQAANEAGNVVSKGRACAEALGLTNALPDGQDVAQVQAEAGERAQRLRELARDVNGADVQDALFRAANFYVQLEQRRADTLGELNTWAQRNIKRVDDLRTICL